MASLAFEETLESATSTLSIRPKTISLYLDLPPSRTFSRRCRRCLAPSRDYEIAAEIVTGVDRRWDRFASVITAGAPFNK